MNAKRVEMKMLGNSYVGGQQVDIYGKVTTGPDHLRDRRVHLILTFDEIERLHHRMLECRDMYNDMIQNVDEVNARNQGDSDNHQ